jgi:hypothetical protein
MGVVSGAVLINGGKVIGVLPRAMVVAGGEGEKVDSAKVYLNEVGREEVLYGFRYYVIPSLKPSIGGNCM